MDPAQTGRPGEIRIDKEGNWFFNDAPIIHQKVLDLFNAGIEPDGSGGYRLHIGEEISPILVEDTPYVVTHLEHADAFTIRLSDGTREPLSLETLYLSADNVPYCSVKNGTFPARFLRPPYYDLARFIEQDGERFFIRQNEAKHYLEIR